MRLWPFTYLVACSVAIAQTGQLPGTGQTACYTTASSGTTDCISDPIFPRQDGSRAATLNYTKIDASGSDLDATAASWVCVRDNTTGLTWEIKTPDGGLRGAVHRYAWKNSDTSRNGGNTGSIGDMNSCGMTLGAQTCNTESYIAAVNATNACGASDWRLPSQMELLTLVHAGNLRPAIDTSYFPNTTHTPYWSATPHAMNPANAWGVHFGYGAAHAENKTAANAVRLVRGTWGQQP